MEVRPPFRAAQVALAWLIAMHTVAGKMTPLVVVFSWLISVAGKTTTFTSPTALFNDAVQSSGGPQPGEVLVLANGVYYDTSPTDFSGGCSAFFPITHVAFWVVNTVLLHVSMSIITFY